MLKKSALCTDIHFGRKNNSESHNQDCLNYLTWFVSQVKADPEIDHVIFLGDWHEHRAAINGLTLRYSYWGAKMLNELGIPIYFIVGNHDLYYRNNRDVYTVNPFEALENFIIVEQPLMIPSMGPNGALISPFLFPTEYETLGDYHNLPIWFGHFEFKGFVVTGDHKTLDHGPEHTRFAKQKRIFSGHFHKRQIKDNVVYIGNTFPADFSDANDAERGMAVYNHITDNLEFINWPEAPQYVKAKLSEVLGREKKVFKPNARVRLLVDVPITYEESNAIKESYLKKYKLREISLEEPADLTNLLSETQVNIEGMELESTDVVIAEMLSQIKSDKIDAGKLVEIFKGLTK